MVIKCIELIMMKKNNMKFINITKDNFNNFLYSGVFLIFISILDVFLNSFFSINLTSFLPGFLSFLLPLIIGFIGLYFIRVEHSGIRNLDILNKNINTNNFNELV